MLLALLALAIVAAALTAPLAVRYAEKVRARRRLRPRKRSELRDLGDPGRERRAEQRAGERLRSCVNDEEWGMSRDLGFIRVFGRMARRAGRPILPARDDSGGAPYAYLIYPHKPIVAFVPKTGRL